MVSIRGRLLQNIINLIWMHETATLENYVETLQRGSLHTVVARSRHDHWRCVQRKHLRTENGKHIDVNSSASPAVLATNVSNADRVSVLQKLWTVYVDILVY